LASEGQKLLQRDREWAQVASEGKDVDKVVSYWTDDAKLFNSGQPVLEGKAALRAYVAESFKLPASKFTGFLQTTRSSRRTGKWPTCRRPPKSPSPDQMERLSLFIRAASRYGVSIRMASGAAS
jgi:hypothetical protein